MRTRARKLMVLGSAVLVVLAVVGAALGYWRGSGSGSASASTRTTQPVTVSPATASTQVYPGGQSAVALTVTNPNPSSTQIGSLTLDTSSGTGGFAVDSSHSGCGVASLSYATQTNGGSGWSVPANGSLAITLPNALSMSTTAANACQGATFNVYLKTGP